MKRLADRRTMLLAAGTAAVAAVAGTVSAQSADIRGTVEFEGGAVIPKGKVEIYIQDPATQGNGPHRAAETRMKSDGGSKTIDFSLPSPESSAASSGAQIVARLERADGWLIARGSAKVEAGSPILITLYTAMY